MQSVGAQTEKLINLSVHCLLQGNAQILKTE
jgi:hypothetical protein